MSATAYLTDVTEFATAALSMEVTGTVGQRKLAAAAARAFRRETAASPDGMDAEARKAFWKIFIADAEDAMAKLGDKKNVDRSGKHSATTVSMVKQVMVRDLTNLYINPWAEGDFTIGLRPAYDALNPKKEKQAPTAESIAKYVRDCCAKYEIPVQDVIKLLA